MPQLNAIGIVVTDMAESIRFYRTLGLDVPETPDEGHVDTFLPERRALHARLGGHHPQLRARVERENGNQIGLAFECSSPAEVDELYAKVVEAGFESAKAPWDAFWGQRYASLARPRGRRRRPVRAALGLSSRDSLAAPEEDLRELPAAAVAVEAAEEDVVVLAVDRPVAGEVARDSDGDRVVACDEPRRYSAAHESGSSRSPSQSSTSVARPRTGSSHGW